MTWISENIGLATEEQKARIALMKVKADQAEW